MNRTKYLRTTLTLLSILLLVTACSSTLPTMNTTLRTASYLNPNLNGHASPVVVVLYQLQSQSSFLKADFFSLYNKPASTLGGDLLDKHEYEARPGRKVTLTQTIAPNTNYIGIIVAYHNLAKSRWRKVIKISNGDTVNLTIDLETQGFEAQLH